MSEAAVLEPNVAPIALPGHFGVAVDQARQLRLSLADRVRLDALLLTLAERGITSDDDRVPLWAAAAVCRTPSERTHFLAAFEDGKAAQAAADGNAPPSPATPPLVDRWLRKRMIVLAGLVLAGMIVIGLVWWFYPRPPEPPEPDCSIPGACLTPRGVHEVIRLIHVSVAGVEQVGAWGLAVWLVPAAVALLWHAWLRRRRANARRQPDPEPRHAGLVDPHAGETMLFAHGRAAFRRLLRHEFAPSRSLNVRGTVTATVRAGGLPTFLYGRRRRTPEYLFLSERASASDHLRLVAKLLHRRMFAEQVPVRHFEFAGHPGVLHRADRVRQGPPEELATVLAAHPNARVLLMAEAHDVCDRDGMPPWLATLSDNREVFHLNPRRAELWDGAERGLADAGIRSWHIGGDGLALLGEPMDAVRRARRSPFDLRPPRPDLAAAFATRRRALLATEPTDEIDPDAVIRDLRRAFDAQAVQWLAALALYPVIVPRLTVALGEHVQDAGGLPLLTEARLLAIARLPWLRAGYMPAWLRGPVARLATRATLKQALPVIQALLLEKGAEKGDDAPIDVQAGQDPKKRGALIEWLVACPESELHDRLLIDALREKPPRRLARDRLEALPRPVRALLGERRLVEAALVGALMASTLWLVPPTTEIAKETSETRLEKRAFDEPDDAATMNDAGAMMDNMTAADATANTDPAAAEATSPTRAKIARPAAVPARDAALEADLPVEEDGPIVNGTPPPAGYVLSGSWTVFFEWGKADISVEARSVLDNVVKASSGAAGTDVFQIECRSDNEFGPVDALRMAERRCQAVAGFLTSRGLASRTMYTLAYGVRDQEGRVTLDNGVREPQSRRAEISIYRPGAPETAEPPATDSPQVQHAQPEQQQQQQQQQQIDLSENSYAGAAINGPATPIRRSVVPATEMTGWVWLGTFEDGRWSRQFFKHADTIKPDDLEGQSIAATGSVNVRADKPDLLGTVNPQVLGTLRPDMTVQVSKVVKAALVSANYWALVSYSKPRPLKVR